MPRRNRVPPSALALYQHGLTMVDLLVCGALFVCVVLLTANSLQLWRGRRRLHMRLQMLEKRHSEELRQQRRIVELSRLHAARQFEIRWLMCKNQCDDQYTQLFSLLEDAVTGGNVLRAWIVNRNGDVLSSNLAARQLLSTLVFTASGLRRMQSNAVCRLSGNAPDFLLIPDHPSENIPELHLFPCSDEEQPAAFLCLTFIPSITGETETDSQLLVRLVRLLQLRQQEPSELSLLESQAELDLIRDMLTLRTLTDNDFESPRVLLQAFLSKLATLTDFERASVYQQSPETGGKWELLASGGTAVSPEEHQAWIELEGTLRIEHQGDQIAPEWISLPAQANRGNPIQLATCLFVSQSAPGTPVTSIVLSSRVKVVQSSIKTELAKWSAQFLPQTFKRAMARLQIEDRARRDGLTRVANRQTFDAELQKALRLSQSTQTNCSLLLIDIDHFKSINDEHGHLTGDYALQAVAAVITHCTQQARITDRSLVARYGGEEFAVLLPEMSQTGARRIAEQIRESIEQKDFRFEHCRLKITASIGVASVPPEEEDSVSLLRRADEALYAAKRAGRNCVRTAFPADHVAKGTTREISNSAPENMTLWRATMS